ncbi:hypothetical protein IX83_01580 [Basilea psittacipulmonis DSM 24701]|uniref:Prepilin type IV endopeptidase peptidase domain-containing protein n=2 Tax=Basilea TaxID=1472344 RepID=A0A077DDE2_9BURK|nr:hypothetical protein IX83_01580 [Basilea psittacipulmonis DSM 24701]
MLTLIFFLMAFCCFLFLLPKLPYSSLPIWAWLGLPIFFIIAYFLHLPASDQILVSFLYILSLIDIQYAKLPNLYTMGLLWLGLLLKSYNPSVYLFPHLLCCSILYLSLNLINLILFKQKKKIAIGGGDIKLLCAISLWLAPHQLINVFIFCSLLSLLYSLCFRTSYIRLGPFIAAPTLCIYFFSS